MRVEIENAGSALIIYIKEKDANLSQADTFKAAVLEQIAKDNHRLVISFKEVEYVDSSFLGALVSILKSLIAVNGKMVLSELNGEILHLFNLTRLDKVFTLKETKEEALKELI